MGFGIEGDITKIFNNYVNKHPECCVLSPDAIYLRMKEEGVITQEQYNTIKKGLIFDFKSQKSNTDGDWKSRFGLQTTQIEKTNFNKRNNQDNYKLVDTKYNENNEIDCEFYDNKEDNDTKTVIYFNNIAIRESSRLNGNIRYIKNDLANFLEKNVNKQNIDQFLKTYGRKDFIDDIFFNKKLNIDQKNEIYNKVLNIVNNENREALKEYVQNNIPNGNFEGNFHQRQGNCVILGRLAAILSRQKGKEKLKERVSIDNNMNVTVTFSGINKKVTVTYEELHDRKYANFSHGNADVKVLEIAWQKLTKYIGGVNNPLTNRAFDTALLGKSSLSVPNPLHLIPGPHLLTNDYYKKEFNNPNKAYAIEVNVTNFLFRELGVYLENENGTKEKIQPAHQFAIIKSDDKYVYLVDPHDSGETLKLKWSDYNKLSFIINEINLK